MPPPVDLYSLATVPIEQFFNGTALGNATGFVWQTGSRYFLVTNWHVVTGRRFPRGQYLRKDAARPNKLRLLLNQRTLTFGKVECDVAIRDTDDLPLWWAHPARNVDVVVLQLPLDGNEPAINMYPVNSLASSNLRLQIGMDVFILGYPFGAPPPGFPVWKRGSIASEPELTQLTTDYMLVDTASRAGMSGSPVIRRSWGTHLLDNGTKVDDGQTATRFVGIYSARLHTALRIDAQLGIVWPRRIIEEIIAGGRRDND